VFCQLETLRHCLPQSVRRTLNELPESLDETYERAITELKRANQVHAYRMLQCLAVAIRPLSVAELAELLAFDFDAANGGIPKLNSDWRWGDHEQAVLSTCSSLVTVVPGDETPVVQFSHFSVKEFLLSDRLATSTRDICQYHISLSDAHTMLVQASLGVLLRDPDVNSSTDTTPLVKYAAEHWVTHAQVENVAPRVRDGMLCLFDPNKPYFEAWVQLHNIDYHDSDTPASEPGARPLYYAALCGFREPVEHLLLKYPKCGSAWGGRRGTALHSASFAGHLQIVLYLLRHDVSVDIRGPVNKTPLQYAAEFGHLDIVQCLLNHGADVHSRDDVHTTPLMWAAFSGHTEVVQTLLEHDADIDSEDVNGWTPLRSAVATGFLHVDRTQLVRLLLDRGANPNAQDSKGQTPLHVVSKGQPRLDTARILLEYGADLDAEDNEGRTPLQVALENEYREFARFLSEFRSERGEQP
jgi:ankyrin repeat protein